MWRLPIERHRDCVHKICSWIDLGLYPYLILPLPSLCLKIILYALYMRIYNLFYFHLHLELWYSVFQLLAFLMCYVSWGLGLVSSLALLQLSCSKQAQWILLVMNWILAPEVQVDEVNQRSQLSWLCPVLSMVSPPSVNQRLYPKAEKDYSIQKLVPLDFS